eukprot:gb/GEZN01006179.1/.p1 GENE.gb/GEZN01006179.1/~~gb/GEZN01006179.1/.p1  ORF type:complete len:356 (+),score=71.23 gb/GEZN01006179.1/:87-1154(+)
MGVCSSGQAALSKQDAEEKKRSKKIEEDMGDHDVQERQVNKLLLLGAGESGKSTLFKQFQNLYGDGFTEEEKAGFIPVIYNNTIQAIKTLSTQVGNYGGLKGNSRESQAVIDALEGDEPIDSSLAKHIQTLWEDPGIVETFKHSAEFQITDSCEYFMERILAYGDDSFAPTFQDMFRTRVRTTGIVESRFKLEGNSFAVFDVGGQRNERKKWIHCFQNVTAVLFVAGISGYDQTLYEDEKTNRIQECLNLFEETINSKFFLDTAMILFLNKQDIFMEKLTRVPLNKCFQDYTGDNSYEDAIAFMTKKFEERNAKPDKPVYIHVTTATDTDNVQTVFEAVKDIIIRTSLKEAGLVE